VCLGRYKLHGGKINILGQNKESEKVITIKILAKIKYKTIIKYIYL